MCAWFAQGHWLKSHYGELSYYYGMEKPYLIFNIMFIGKFHYTLND